ncbi:MAG TPA: hypothetical protein VM123_20010 [archaeon]|nr:hypothetical protein [archaeon]
MSSKKHPAEQKTAAEESISGLDQSLEGKTSDFWWNIVYFLILSIAITFILVNNSLADIISPTGIIILAVLVLLDVFPAAFLIKLLIRLLLHGRRM